MISQSDYTNEMNKIVYRQNKTMEMNVHSRKFAPCSKADEQLVADDRNNNLKNGQIMEQQQTVNAAENNKQSNVTQWNHMDELQVKCQNSEPNIEKHDTHSNDSHSSGPMVETIKTNAAINFSVESILNGSSCTKNCDTHHFDQKSFEKVSSAQKSTVSDGCNRIYRPMPMRYMSNPTLYHGKGK